MIALSSTQKRYGLRIAFVKLYFAIFDKNYESCATNDIEIIERIP